MNIQALPSDYLIEFRQRFRELFVPGSEVSQTRFEWAMKRMNTAIALVQEAEEETRILEHKVKVGRDSMRNRRAAAGITDIIANESNVARLLPPQK